MTESAPPASYCFGHFELQRNERRLLAAGKPIHLGSRAFDLLAALVERPGQVVTKNELLDLVWPGLVVEENNLQVQISTLRKVLGPRAIATIPGRGYRLATALHAPTNPATPNEPAPKLRTNLPQPLPPLHGREEDLEALGALINQHQLVTVLGAGGMGKTLLAQHLLETRRELYPHGVCWVELGAVTDPALIPATIAYALGVDAGKGEPLNALCAAIAPLSMLVALDNAEHLIADVAGVAKALIAAAPDIRLLVTTQAPLNLAAEWLYRIGPLAVPPDSLPAAQALDFSAVLLFVERARASDAHFAFTDANASVVIELCRHLDGLPLAIELAAARVPMLGVQKLLLSMQDRLKLLNASRNRDAPLRQQTLLAALEWSHGFLDERERAVFRRLAVFSGSASLAAIQQVLPDTQGELNEWAVMDALSVLVDRSLVTVVANDDPGNPRYRLLESPRAYALDRLNEAGESEMLRRRHAAAMAAQLDAAFESRFAGNIGVDRWFATTGLDLDNAREALAWAREAGENEIELRIIAGLLLTLPHSLYAERGALAERCATLITPDTPARLQLRGCSELSRVWVNTNRRRGYEAARLTVQLARELDAEAPDRFLLYKSLCELARSPVRVNEIDETLLAEARAIEDPTWPPHRLVCRVRSESFLAALCRNPVESLRHNHRVIALDRASGAESTLAQCDLVDAELAAGNAVAAVRTGVALVAALAGTRRELDLAYAQLNLTAARLALNDLAQARSLALTAWPLGLRFELQPYWADYFALLAALENRRRTAARLIGYADAGYAAREQDRALNEAAAISRARTQALAALSRSDFDRLCAGGAMLRDEDIARLAFGANDEP